MIRSAVFVALAIVYVADSRSPPRPPQYKPYCSGFNRTATDLYDSKSEKCCLGTVHTNSKPTVDKCCGSNILDTSKELCCSGKTVAMQPGHLCCGETTYDSDSAICCEKEVIDVNDDDVKFMRCCGKKSYDLRKQKCCRNNGESSILDKENDNQLCCGDKLYDHKTQMCCRDHTQSPPKEQILTKTDPDKNRCCGDGLISSLKEDCCSGKPYNKESDVCCEDKIITKQNPEENACCGDTLYDMENAKCCGGVLFQNVSSEPRYYDTPIYLEKRSTTHWRNPRPRPMFRPPTHTCCGDELLDRSKDDDMSCCVGKQTYNHKNQICCSKYTADGKFESKVVDKDDHTRCCDLQAYDTNKQICCNTYEGGTSNGKLHDKASDSAGCCGKQTYDHKTQLCCRDHSKKESDSVIVELPEADAKKERSASPPHYLRLPSFGCCKLKPYKYETEHCCGDDVIPVDGDKKCCAGNSAYEPEKEICCGENVLPKKEGKDSCCTYGETDDESFCPSFSLIF